MRVKDVKFDNLELSRDVEVLYTERLLDAETSAKSVTLCFGRGDLRW